MPLRPPPGPVFPGQSVAGLVDVSCTLTSPVPLTATWTLTLTATTPTSVASGDAPIPRHGWASPRPAPAPARPPERAPSAGSILVTLKPLDINLTANGGALDGSSIAGTCTPPDGTLLSPSIQVK